MPPMRSPMDPRVSLYDPQTEHDACGIGFIAMIDGTQTHDVVSRGIETLERLEHRGACGCDPESGDGSGLIFQTPHELFTAVCPQAGIDLPDRGTYGVGMTFLPPAGEALEAGKALLEQACDEYGLNVLGWRDVPVDVTHCGQVSLSTKPHIAQIFVAPKDESLVDEAFERRLYLARRVAEHRAIAAGGEIADHFYVCSLSCRTIIYKGMLTPPQVSGFFPDSFRIS